MHAFVETTKAKVACLDIYHKNPNFFGYRYLLNFQKIAKLFRFFIGIIPQSDFGCLYKCIPIFIVQ